mmetsp:Transcript_78476/g.198054  ORF Transcript_78476/g.198054 Transcript_78476/m.198054 type:complete len:499 (+) Transcript_78476:1007-2503(+)
MARRAVKSKTQKPSGGLSAPLKREWARKQKEKRDARYGRLDPNRPPPASGGPTGGAWKDGRPESESMRQGEFQSPFTGQVYDRWAPIGLKQKGTDRQGGLGRSRAYETPMQRKIRTAIEPPQEKKVEEWEKYYPGTAPPQMRPKPKIPRAQRLKRHGLKAGTFEDIWTQLCIQTVIDLKIAKSEKPIWYVELCTGEGEYHISRLAQPGDDDLKLAVRWPRAEDVYEVLRDQDLEFYPPEIQGWMDGVKLLNASEDVQDFVEQGDKVDTAEGDLKWLPSTTLLALRKLREQDAVTLWEDNPIAFAALNNFMRNWSSKFEAKLELLYKNGIRDYDKIFCEKKVGTKAHGQIDGRRGIILVDPSPRGGEIIHYKKMFSRLHLHWKAATVVATYPTSEKNEVVVEKYLKDIRQADPHLDLLLAELTVDTPEYLRDIVDSKWYGQGIIISNPSGETGERIRDAAASLCEEMSQHADATPMRVKVEKLKYQEPKRRVRRAQRDW